MIWLFQVCDSDGQNQVLLQAQLESNEDVVQVLEFWFIIDDFLFTFLKG